MKNVKTTVKPTTKEELRKLILETIKNEGNECDLNFIDTSLITDMSRLFQDLHDFNGKISNWDVSNVTDMHDMFFNALTFNQPLDTWDMSNVIDMSGMFSLATSFNQPLDSWQVTDRTVTSDMFLCSKLKSLPEWFR